MTSFQNQLVGLVRAFGWHRPASTPCGRSVPIAEAHALLELSQKGAMTQTALAARINLRKSTVSRLVGNLERHGWVHRTQSASDGRAYDVSLTTAGKEAAADLARARKAKMDGILARIPEDQRGSVTRSLRTLVKAIHESDGHEGDQ